MIQAGQQCAPGSEGMCVDNSQKKANQTICPYTAKPLISLLPGVNDEHVLPVAIGAPASFYVKASAAANSAMNELIDAPFSNSGLIRFLAMAQGVVSRSGPVIANLPGKILETGDSIRLAMSTSHIDVSFDKPVVVDPQTKRVVAVKGYGSKAMAHAQRIKKDYQKKQLVVEIGERLTTHNPEIQVSLEADNQIINRELVKICYLFSVWVFGDSAITSTSGAIYRKALECEDPQGSDPSLLTTDNEISGITPPTSGNSHYLSSTVIGEHLVTHVSLFGIFSLTLLTPSTGIGCEFAGLAVTIDLTTGRQETATAIDQALRNVRSRFP